MIIVTLKGADVFLSGEVERALFPLLAKVYNVDENELILHAQDGYLYHDGMDQTSFNLIVKVEADVSFESKEKEAAECIIKVMKNYAIHTRVYFAYFESKHVYESINEEYPLFINSGNVASFENDEESEVEVYDGNIFEEYEDVLPVDDEE